MKNRKRVKVGERRRRIRRRRRSLIANYTHSLTLSLTREGNQEGKVSKGWKKSFLLNRSEPPNPTTSSSHHPLPSFLLHLYLSQPFKKVSGQQIFFHQEYFTSFYINRISYLEHLSSLGHFESLGTSLPPSPSNRTRCFRSLNSAAAKVKFALFPVFIHPFLSGAQRLKDPSKWILRGSSTFCMYMMMCMCEWIRGDGGSSSYVFVYIHACVKCEEIEKRGNFTLNVSHEWRKNGRSFSFPISFTFFSSFSPPFINVVHVAATRSEYIWGAEKYLQSATFVPPKFNKKGTLKPQSSNEEMQLNKKRGKMIHRLCSSVGSLSGDIIGFSKGVWRLIL